MTLRSTLSKLPVFRSLLPAKNESVVDSASGSLAWRGAYINWEEALKNSGGYDQQNILNEVLAGTLQVKSGKVAYERDGVLFDTIQYSWPLVAILLKAALDKGGSLNVVDFGGSLGSSYFQNRDMLALGTRLQWSVIEQKHFVDCGKQFIADESLHFYYDIEESLVKQAPDVLLLSGVLAYLDLPYKKAEYFNKLGFSYIIIDRNAFTRSGQELLTTQLVSPGVSYPTWFMNKEQLLNTFNNYQLVSEFPDTTTQPVLINNKECYWAGLILKKLH